MTQQNMGVPGPQAGGCFHIGFMTDAHYLSPRQTGELGQIRNADGHHGAVQARPDDGDKYQGNQHFGE